MDEFIMAITIYSLRIILSTFEVRKTQ